MKKKSKKGLFLAFGICILFAGTTIGNVYAENITAVKYIDFDKGIISEVSKKDFSMDYVSAITVSAIKELNGVLDCEINFNVTDDENVFVNVMILATENVEDNILEAGIAEYVSSAFDIPTENITMSIK